MSDGGVVKAGILRLLFLPSTASMDDHDCFGKLMKVLRARKQISSYLLCNPPSADEVLQVLDQAGTTNSWNNPAERTPRPPNAWVCFLAYCSRSLHLPFKVTRLCWKIILSEASKTLYTRVSKIYLVRHRARFPSYKFCPRPKEVTKREKTLKKSTAKSDVYAPFTSRSRVLPTDKTHLARDTGKNRQEQASLLPCSLPTCSDAPQGSRVDLLGPYTNAYQASIPPGMAYPIFPTQKSLFPSIDQYSSPPQSDPAWWTLPQTLYSPISGISQNPNSVASFPLASTGMLPMYSAVDVYGYPSPPSSSTSFDELLTLYPDLLDDLLSNLNRFVQSS